MNDHARPAPPVLRRILIFATLTMCLGATDCAQMIKGMEEDGDKVFLPDPDTDRGDY